MRSRLFWLTAGLVAYTYVAFPLVILLRGRIRRRPYRCDEITPSVSVIIAARNEREAIGAKVDNCLALDYPADRLDVIIASDGSDDGTDDVARMRGSSRVRVLALPRVGKAAALEAAVAASTGEILVFSDANSLYDSGAVKVLVRPFADPGIGGVAGDQRYRRTAAADGTARGERTYWNFDRIMKRAESRAGNTISATGAIYAIRRRLFAGVPVGVTDDFAISTSVIAQGYRLVFEGDAVAWEPVASSGQIEWGRKVRVITRGLRAVHVRRELLDPRRHGFYAVQLFTHKLLRRLMAVPLLTMAALAPTLWGAGAVYRVMTLGQSIVCVLGVAGLLFERTRIGRHPTLAVPGFFLLVNGAALMALWNIVRGRSIDRWEPARAGGSPSGASSTQSVGSSR